VTEFTDGRMREVVPDLGKALRNLQSANGDESDDGKFGLTARELQIVAAILSGCTNKDIADRLALSPQTVKHHLANIFDKLGVSSRLELALHAVHHRLIDQP
jgi:DNA-binding NarL/FixJ family response regulator